MNMLLKETVVGSKSVMRRLEHQVPADIRIQVEEERERRFEIMMDVPPFKLLNMLQKKLLHWMQKGLIYG